ncbi:hypothetical protein [Acinetobacter pollinis]|uniref:hypothetical protein n=1 Tax=Acinetobacter pollinis TaxID=2605270 RepID=UPI0018A30F6A|nr:hypothetical protein [Acinetobacter pollinis]MBF7691126.1 hypothetical protein [Acinetobacter pollinis]MBF7698772.1 hypothetical protein [Acinetobacter pollinis]
MIDWKKEQKEFHKEFGTLDSWVGWKKRAELADEEADVLCAEITELKQKLEKLESGEFVLVPRDKIEVFWQDDDEPENFCSLESDLECLGDGIDLNEIMTINAHHQVNLKTEKMYGTWFAEFGHPKEKANFHVGTHQECLDIVAKNKAMIEASQQPTNFIDGFIASGGFDRVMGCKNGE